MTLLRYGPPGKERPGLLDEHGSIGDLSTHVQDTTPGRLASGSYRRRSGEGVPGASVHSEKPAKFIARVGERRYHEVDVTLSHANRIALLGQMSAWVAHEINQPVAATVTNAQAALRFLEGPEPNLEAVRQALARIVRLGNRISEIVGRTRALVQRVPTRKDDFEINEAIREIISLSQEELAKNDVSVHTRFEPDLPFLQADRIQLQQVILNLIMNAVEAMSGVPEGPRELRISTVQTRSGYFLVAVQDSGPGLDTQNPDRIFDAFYSTKPGGLGMGLSICRAIIEAHGGRLWASLSEPHGAKFQFTLPLNSNGSYTAVATDPD
jgi:C4-dicarboxylate-specific signal transduction histidine kinase